MPLWSERAQVKWSTGGTVVVGAVGRGVGVVAGCGAALRQPESTDSIAVFSAGSMLSSHRAFTATQPATYSQRYPTAGGSHSAGSRSPFDRFEDAETRRSASAAKSRHLRTLLVENELRRCLRRNPMLLQAGQGGRYRTTVGSLLLFHRRLKAIGHWLAGSHRSFPRAPATLRRGLRIGCCNGRRRDQTSGRTGHGHSRHQYRWLGFHPKRVKQRLCSGRCWRCCGVGYFGRLTGRGGSSRRQRGGRCGCCRDGGRRYRSRWVVLVAAGFSP